MISHLLNKILSAGRGKTNDLMEIVPIIIFAAIWVLGFIIKIVRANSGKKTDPFQPKAKGKPQRPNDLEDFVRMVKQRYAAAKQEVGKSFQQREYVERAASRPSQAVQVPPVSRPAPRPQPPPAMVPEPKAPPVFKESSPVFAEERTAEAIFVGEAYEKHPNPYLAEITGQFSKSDGLRRAILYSEILGKPVGMREG